MELFEGAGDFWTLVMLYLRRVKKWPMIENTLAGRGNQGAIETAPADRTTAADVWVTGGKRLPSIELGEPSLDTRELIELVSTQKVPQRFGGLSETPGDQKVPYFRQTYPDRQINW
jgi:hypothetical protein